MKKCNLKALGITLIAALSLSAVLASGASAEFTSGSDNTTATAEATTPVVFTDGENQMVCTENPVQSATVGTVQTSLTAEPPIAGHCTLTLGSLGTLVATADFNGCDFTIENSLEEIGRFNCPEGKHLEVTAKILGTFRKCIDVHAQAPTVGAVHVHNLTDPETGKMALEVESAIEGITYEKTGTCAFGTIEGDNMSLQGSATVTGDDEFGSPVDVTVN